MEEGDDDDAKAQERRMATNRDKVDCLRLSGRFVIGSKESHSSRGALMNEFCFYVIKYRGETVLFLLLCNYTTFKHPFLAF